MKILIFLGTARPNSNSEKVALWVYTQLRSVYHHDCTLVSPHTLALHFQTEGYDYPAPELKKMIKEAQAFIIVTPEYNHSFPGSLKFMLDIGKRSDYLYKPVGFVGITDGDFGASRAIEALLPVVRTLGMIPVYTDVNITKVLEIFDERDAIKDPDIWQKRLGKMVEQLKILASKLK